MGILLGQFPGSGGQVHEGQVQCDQCGAFGPLFRETVIINSRVAAYIARNTAGHANKEGWRTVGYYPDIRCQCPGCYAEHPDYLPGASGGEAPAAAADEPADTATLAPADPPEPTTGRRRRRGIQLTELPSGTTPRCPDTLDLVGLEYQPGHVYALPLDLLVPDPKQPRVDFSPEALADLAASLLATGQETPITFRVGELDIDGVNALVVVHGERRWRAAQLAGLPTIDGILDTHGTAELPADRLLRQAGHNATQEGHTPWDYACLVKRLSEPPHNMRVGEIALELARRGIRGKSRPVVSNLLALHRLPVWVTEAIRAEELTVAHGKYLLPHIERAPIMAAMEAWFREGGGPSADDTTDPPGGEEEQEETLETMEQRARQAHSRTIVAMRGALLRAYAKHYQSLDDGKWDGERYISVHIDRETDCAGCPEQITIAGQHNAQHYCPNQACFDTKNKNAADALQRQKNADWEQQTESNKATISAHAQQRQADAMTRQRIAAALAELDDDQTALGIFYWQRSELKMPLAQAVAEVAAGNLARLLGPIIADSGTLWNPEYCTELAAYLRIDIESGAPARESPDGQPTPTPPCRSCS